MPQFRASSIIARISLPLVQRGAAVARKLLNDRVDHIALTLPPDDYGRSTILRALSLFMAYKQALAFTLASELIKPDAVYCVGISPKERFAYLARIVREPKPWTAKSFGEVEWLPKASIDPMLLDLLPGGARHPTAIGV